jgi:hypothetical protein
MARNTIVIRQYVLTFSILCSIAATALSGVNGAGPLTPHQDIPRYSVIDDSICAFYPYYKFMQLYDSVKVYCILGEYGVRSGGAVTGLQPSDFDLELHKPLCTLTLVELSQRQIYESASVAPGDTIEYFANLIVEPVHRLAATRVGIVDTIRFILQIYEHSTDMWLADIDTLGLYPVDDPDSLALRFFGNRDTSLIRKHVVSVSEAGDGMINLKMKCEVHGSSPHHLLCREDIILPELYSDITMAQIQLRSTLIDSLNNNSQAFISLLTGLKDAHVPVLLSVHPNPARERVSINFMDEKIGTSLSFRVIDESGRTLISTTAVTYSGGVFSMEIDIRGLSQGVYYVIPIIGNQVLLGKQFSLIK